MNTSGDVVLVPYNGNYTVGIIPGELGLHGDIAMNGYPINGVNTINSQSGTLNVSGTVNITGDLTVSGTINGSSDRNIKENFAPIDNGNILERVASLPISSWSYKQDPETRHLGPMAQDFYSAFNVGTDDKHIATVDEGGVALAAIQGLNEKLNEKDAEIKTLEKRLADLEQSVKSSTQK